MACLQSVVLVLTVISYVNCYTSNYLDQIIHLNLRELPVTQKCKIHLEKIKNETENNVIWPLKMMDASGAVESSFVWGNNYWLGSKTGCARIENPYDLHLDSRFKRLHLPNLTQLRPPFPVTYQVVYAKHYSTMQIDTKIYDKSILHIGLCLPSSCDNYDTAAIATEIFNLPDFSGKELLGDNVVVMFSKTLELSSDFATSSPVILSICVLLTLISLTVIFSIIKGVRNHFASSSQLIISEKTIIDEKKMEPKKKRSILERFEKCFSICDNAKIIFATNLSESSLPVIHGIRAITLSWILMVHLLIYMLSSVSNLPQLLTYSRDWYMQPLNAAAISVDTFFVVGGVLISYLFFEERKRSTKKDGIVTILKTVANRILRIAPSYYVAMLIAMVVSMYLNDKSQFLQTENNADTCSKYWWRNMLMITNFFPFQEMCLSWSWYLSVDFQCFTIGTILLVIWSNNKWIASALFSGLFFGSTFYSAYVGYMSHYQFTLDVFFATIDQLYTSLWIRIPVYFCGMIGGWYLSTFNRKLNMKKETVWILFTLAIVSSTFLLFVRLFDNISPLTAMLYTGFSKIVWAMAITWIIVACGCNKLAPAKKVLEAKVLLPFSRVSYAAYLINPIIITFLMSNKEAALFLDFPSLLYVSLGIFWCVLIFATVFMIFVENPITMLVRTFIERKS